MARTEMEVIAEVQAYCKTPQKQSHIILGCNLAYKTFMRLVKKGVIKLHHKEKGTGRYGSHYYIVHKANKEKNKDV